MQQQQKMQQQQQQRMMQQRQMEEMRQKQMEEQRRRLDENRKRLEEANRKRIEDQQKKMEQIKRQQEEMAAKAAAENKRREEELAQRREETRAASAIRRIAHKLRSANLLTIDSLKMELKEIMDKELENCASIKDQIKEECDAAVAQADEKMKQLEEAKKKEEERKAELERQLKERAEKAERLLREFSTLVVDAEEAFNALSKQTEPFTSTADFSLEEIAAAGEACNAAGEASRAKTKACLDFAAQNGNDMKPVPRRPGEAPPDPEKEKEKLDFRTLLNRVNAFNRNTESTLTAVAASRVKATKKTEAKIKLSATRRMFEKYDQDGDDTLSRKELQAYTKGELAFVVPVADMDRIIKVLVEEGKRGVSFGAFSRFKAAVGISREKARDEKRKEQRLAKEKAIEGQKEIIRERSDQAAKVIAEAAESIVKLLEIASPLVTKAKTMKSKDMVSLADEVGAMVKETIESVSAARKLIDAVGEDPQPDLQSFVAAETAKLNQPMSRFDSQISQSEANLTKFRQEITRTEASEVDTFRGQAIKMIRYHQSEKALSAEDVFTAFDRSKAGRIDEGDFQAFFKTCEKPPANEDPGHDGEVVLSEEDCARLFNDLDENDEGAISKDTVMGLIRCFKKVLKETVITNTRSIKDSKPERRLEVNELCEVLEGPVKEETADLMRARVRILKDGMEGWVTILGNQGTKFLEEPEGGVVMKVVKETILTTTFDISGESAKEQSRKIKDTTRKLKEGELLEIREWMKKDEASGLMRMKVRTRVGGHIGWATAVGSAGAVFLEVA